MQLPLSKQHALLQGVVSHAVPLPMNVPDNASHSASEPSIHEPLKRQHAPVQRLSAHEVVSP